MSWWKRSLFLTTLVLLPALSFADEGGALFVKKCASCHGRDGKGQTKMGEKLKIKDLTDGKIQGSFTDDEAIKKVTEGINDETTGKVKMPGNKNKLTDDDIKAVVKFVRTLKVG